MLKEFGTTKLTNQPAGGATQLRLIDGPLQLSWQHCSQTSDFVGSFFAAMGDRAGLDRVEARHNIGYLMNELLENTFKFRAVGDVVIETTLEHENFELKLSNFIGEETALRF